MNPTSRAIVLLALVTAVVVYAFTLRRWFRSWGAMSHEIMRRQSGDAWVTAPSYETNLAITIQAQARDVWPWLVQMGFRRGGLYSYDWLDRLFGYLDRPSADRVLPEFQRLEVGDTIPIGRAGGFPVRSIDPNRSLLLAGEADSFRWSWEFRLDPIDERRTRLSSRNRAHVPATFGSWCLLRVLEPAAFLMTRRMLIGIARRAEALANAEHLGRTSTA
jgi:hypothetical protein